MTVSGQSPVAAINRSVRRLALPRNIATATPQTFTMASPPTELNGFGVQTPSRSTLGQRLVHCAPAHIRQVGARLRNYRASNTSSLTLHLLISLDRPALSGSASTSRLCQGRLPPSPALPGSGCPQLHQAAATTQRGWSLTTPRHTQRLVAHSSAPKKTDADIKSRPPSCPP